jgi:hypothetical protein
VPEEQRIRALVHRGDGAPDLLAAVRRQPSAALEPAAPVLVGTPGPWYTPSRVRNSMAVSFIVIASPWVVVDGQTTVRK